MKLLNYIVIGFIAINLLSCKTTNLFETKQYNNTISIDSLPKLSDKIEHRLRVDDKISISVADHEDLSIGSVFGVYNSDEVYGKWILIDSDGYGTLPKIGKVKLEGLTIREAENKISNLYETFIVNPIVVVNVHNWDVSILGEVIEPGTFKIQKNNNSILQYLAKAGGFDAYADKRNVMLLRMHNGSINEYALDLTNLDQYNKLQINLMPDDVIYIPTTKGKKLDQRASTLLPFASFISALAIIVTLL